MVVTCEDCDEPVRPVVSSIVQHNSCSRGCCGQKYTANLKLECECTTETPQRTELDSIKVSGGAPDNWL